MKAAWLRFRFFLWPQLKYKGLYVLNEHRDVTQAVQAMIDGEKVWYRGEVYDAFAKRKGWLSLPALQMRVSGTLNSNHSQSIQGVM